MLTSVRATEVRHGTLSVLAQKDVQDALAAQGITVIGGSPAEAVPFFKSELDKHAALVKRSGATVE